MNDVDVLEMSRSKMNLAVNSYIISFVALVIVVALLVIMLKSTKKGLLHHLSKIVPMVLCAWVFFVSLSEGINAHIVSDQLNLDSREMLSYTTSGEIEDTLIKAKLFYIVINSENYICSEFKLKTDVSTGKAYKIKYLRHSHLIIEIEDIK